MGNPVGFKYIRRKIAGYRPIEERINDYSEVETKLSPSERIRQAERCMDCGTPTCQWGCPVANIMPEWQHYMYTGQWKMAIDNLHSTNNFPEFTGKICPAPCENACVLNIHEEPVTIRENESAVVEKAFEMGYIKPLPPKVRSGKKVAVIGSGPSGLACADLLNKWGHSVILYEKDDAPGGILRYGIPDFKLNKQTIDRRLAILLYEGLNIKANTEVGIDISASELIDSYDAICLAIGAMKPRDLQIEGRELKGIHFAMEYLTQQNKINSGQLVPAYERISARNKHVVIIGGGDTGSDCVGTAIRQKARSVTQIEILPKPPLKRSLNNPWPYWANVLRQSSSHEEGCERKWSLTTKKFIGTEGNVSKLLVKGVKWIYGDNRMQMEEIEGSEEYLNADMVLLAMGFLHPVHEGIADNLSLQYTERGNIQINEKSLSNTPKVFAAGDATLGASLVVRAIMSGRKAAGNIDKYLKYPGI